MENFTITTRMTSKKYAKVMLIGLYKKPGFILTTLFGLYYLTALTYEYLHPVENYEIPYYEFLIGAFIVFAPLLIVLISVNQFNSNPSFRNDIKYTFGENGLLVEGTTFKAEYLWAHIIKQKEIGKFIILYHTKKMGNFIDKEKLTLNQLDFIKSKVGKINFAKISSTD
ncbi:MAG: YcxB family protein [Flavobacterium sp.]|uniref:YcxB family protein n=1 Tax=Flavobacterium sp. TaxID=239 RepID=UPI0032658526